MRSPFATSFCQTTTRLWSRGIKQVEASKTELLAKWRDTRDKQAKILLCSLTLLQLSKANYSRLKLKRLLCWLATKTRQSSFWRLPVSMELFWCPSDRFATRSLQKKARKARSGILSGISCLSLVTQGMAKTRRLFTPLKTASSSWMSSKSTSQVLMLSCRSWMSHTILMRLALLETTKRRLRCTKRCFKICRTRKRLSSLALLMRSKISSSLTQILLLTVEWMQKLTGVETGSEIGCFIV